MRMPLAWILTGVMGLQLYGRSLDAFVLACSGNEFRNDGHLDFRLSLFGTAGFSDDGEVLQSLS